MPDQREDTNIQKHISLGATGLDSNSSLSQIKPGSLTYALNAVVSSYDDGNEINYQNEVGNIECIKFPDGYSVVGAKTFTSIGKIIFFLSSQNNSQIGYTNIDDCEYNTIISSPCLNFNIEHPIHRVVCEVNGEAQRLYWVDNYNPDRFIDLTNLPYKVVKTGPNACDIQTTTEIDCNLIKINPNISIPYIEVTNVTTGGQLVEGTYQFGVQYSDSIGTGYTGVYNITNPVPIFANKVTQDFNNSTDKAIQLLIDNLDTERYQYYNLIVVKSINNIPTPELVGTYPTTNNSITYSGEGEYIKLSSDDVFQEFPIYEKSNGITSSDGVLIRHGVTEQSRVNYQSIASQIELDWVQYLLPPTAQQDDPIIASSYRGYFSDEIYAFEIQPILKSGKKCDGFHIPCRPATDYEREIITNPFYNPEKCADQPTSGERWMFENTATATESYEGDYNDSNPQLSSISNSIDKLEKEIDDINTEINDNYTKLNNDIVGIQSRLYDRKYDGKSHHSLWVYVGNDGIKQIDEATQQRPIDVSIIESHINDSLHASSRDRVIDIANFSKDINALWEENNDLTLQLADKTNTINTLYAQYNEIANEHGYCDPQPVSYGKFGYYESKELYPCNEDIWGDLAGKPIRHHRFPNIIPYDNKQNNFILGVRLDVDKLREIIKNDTTLTQEQKDDIEGFKILRANRVGHKSVIAKGTITNVGIYTRDKQTYFYPNYPYNDVRPDPFLSIAQTRDDSGRNIQLRLNGFSTPEAKKRFIFHSPDTSFYQPHLGDYIQLEGIIYGESTGHFVPVKDHPKYQILSRAAYATVVAITMGLIGAGSKEGIGVGGLDFLGGAETNWEEALTVFQEAIDIILKSIPHKQFAYQFNSIGDYNKFKPLPQSQKRIFPIEDNSRYLSDGLASIQDSYQLNNFLRETGVFIKTADTVPFTHEIYPELQDTSRYIASDVSCTDGTEGKADISSYYVSLKRFLSAQYGQIYSYETIDTGTYVPIDAQSTNIDIFGGDAFISKFAYKTKHSFFTQNLVKRQDNLALNFRDYGNYAYPTYWLSNERDGEFTWADLLQGATGILAGAAAGGLGSMSIGGAIRGAVAGGILGAIGVLSDNWLNNLDCAGKKFFYQSGKFYLFAYGIPYFWTESEVNCNYRQAFNAYEGDFYPHTGKQIPDDWLQETNVPIVNDNNYFYNKTFSKQNKEAYTHHLPNDFDPNRSNTYTNRAVYSEKQASETNYKINKWLLYRPLSYFDFPQTNGKLISLDSIENRAILARYENKMEMYDAMLTIDTSNPQAAYIGNTTLFRKSPPIEFSDVDIGYTGTHHKFFLKTPKGNISIDAKRGNIFLIQGTRATEISNNISNYLSRNLPFQILTYFPDLYIDNNFNGIGLHGTYDVNQDRFIVTKLDYIPKMMGITYKEGKFYYNDQQVQLTDTNFFDNKSFTLSYSFKNNNWVSYHSYLPLYYIETSQMFYSGTHGKFWAHDLSNISFNKFYGEIHPYILEFPYSYKYRDEILQHIQDYTRVYQYFSDDPNDYVEVDDVYFDEALLYSNKQCSGTLLLVPKPKGNMKEYLKYPIYDTGSKTILYTKSNQYYQYNTFWSLVKDHKKPLFKQGPNLSLPKVINNDNMDYSKRSFKKTPLMTADLKVRHTLNTTDRYKIASQFLIAQTQQSYK